MSQHDFDISTGDANTGNSMRSEINAAIQALATLSSGPTAPATDRPYQFWADTTTGYLKIRNAADSAWITLFKLDNSINVLGAATATTVSIGGAAIGGYLLSIAGDFTAASGTGSTLRFENTTLSGMTTDSRIGHIEFYGNDADTPGASVRGFIQCNYGSQFAQDSYMSFGVNAAGFVGAEYMRLTDIGLSVTGIVAASTHNTYDLGTTAVRWKNLWLQSGAFNGSDARLKTAVEPFTPAEINAAKQLSKEIGLYQWLDSIEKKGAENARLHAGLTVQRAIEIMTDNGLDWTRYGFIGYDSWESTETTAVGDAYSFRYDQLNLFIARGFEARLSALEAA